MSIRSRLAMAAGVSVLLSLLISVQPATAATTGSNVLGTSPNAIATADDPPSTGISFTDTGGHVFQSEIAWLAAHGISTGWEVAPGTYEFRPQAQILRGEMAAFLYRLAGQPEFTPPTDSPFVDVATGFVFYKQIAWLASTGISRGWPTGSGSEFRPFSSTSRDVMATFLNRFQHSPAYTPSVSPFRDVNYPSTVFSSEILWLAAQGISTGWSIGHGCYEYRPYQNVTRSEMAAFIYRMENGGVAPLTGNTCAPPPSPLIADHISPGAFCGKEVAGWYGYTSGGVLMQCVTSPTENRLRWRAA